MKKDVIEIPSTKKRKETKLGKELSVGLEKEREYWRKKIEKIEETHKEEMRELREEISSYEERERYYEAKSIVAEYEGEDYNR